MLHHESSLHSEEVRYVRGSSVGEFHSSCADPEWF